MAFAADVAILVVGCMLVLLTNDLTGSRVLPYGGEFGPYHFFSIWTWLLAAAAVGAWWTIQQRGRRAHRTIAMRLMGLWPADAGSISPIALAARTVATLVVVAGVAYWFGTVAGIWA